MDYLDPQKKRRKRNALMLMYVLIGIAISIATVTLVYLINGYSIDRNTGEVIQNGLIYVDSKPESAEVYLNGEKQKGRTDLRLVIPEGFYDIQMKRDGYRDWGRDIVLEGGSLRRLTYSRLVPNTIDSELAINLPIAPTLVTQSIDKRWVVMAFIDNPLQMRVVDLNKDQFELVDLKLPLDLLDTKAAGSWEVIDWADDNKTFLAVYKTDTSNEYVLINREDATKSKKLKSVFPTINYTEVSFFERKNDLVYLFDGTGKVLYKADVNDGRVELVLNNVISYKTFGSDSVLYITDLESEAGSVTARLKNGDKDYKLRTLKQDTKYLLDISKLGNDLVMGVGSPLENRVVIYNDPIGAIKQNDFSDIPVPTTVLKIDNPEELSISSDSSCIVVRGGQRIATHEFEADRSYAVQIDAVPDPDQEIIWLDGQHLLFVSAGVQYMMDFDGSNQYDLMPTIASLSTVANKDINFIYSFKQSDQPDAPVQMIRNFMRTKEDR
ncbi:MAG: PEGA domain-containing protein [Candidatus Saccharibacteria bacterium]|nr:PEGA domain-containing protein [Candidatus Saccharibacteria bacterium]